jgi:signal transduction histidine kinase
MRTRRRVAEVLCLDTSPGTRTFRAPDHLSTRGQTLARIVLSLRGGEYEPTMLHEFLSTHRGAILARTRARVAARTIPRATVEEIDGIPLFLDQLIEILRSAPVGESALAEGAARHGVALLHRGFTVAQVVHDYGGVCQAVTEIADETDASISPDEFRVFNRCLDDAIAEAVSEYTRQREQSITAEGRERMGELAHELRNAAGAAIVSFEVLRMGKVGLEGSTAGVLSRSLQRLTNLINCSLTEVRLESGALTRERVSVRELIEQVAVGSSMEASARGLGFDVTLCEAAVDAMVDRQLIAASIANLLQNAFKFTHPGSRVSLRAVATDKSVLIEVEDQCGGLPAGKAAELFRPFEQRGADRTGLGLGLSISRKSVAANGGELRVRDIAGTGCVFTIELPRLA